MILTKVLIYGGLHPYCWKIMFSNRLYEKKELGPIKQKTEFFLNLLNMKMLLDFFVSAFGSFEIFDCLWKFRKECQYLHEKFTPI